MKMQGSNYILTNQINRILDSGKFIKEDGGVIKFNFDDRTTMLDVVYNFYNDDADISLWIGDNETYLDSQQEQVIMNRCAEYYEKEGVDIN